MSVSLPQQGVTTSPKQTTAPPKQVVDPGKTRRKGWILSLIAGVLAILAGVAASMYLNQLAAEIGTTQQVVVAAEVIPARALVTPDMLTVKELPVKYLAPTYFLNMGDIADGRTTAMINISPGEYIQQNMVNKNSGLEDGKQAVTIGVNQITSVGNSVRQGNFVDIIVSYQSKQNEPTTEVLLQNVKILAVNNLLPANGGTGGTTYLPAGSTGRTRLASTQFVTLELTKEEVLLVTHAENFADELRLVIRRLDDKSTPNIDPVHLFNNEFSQMQIQTVPAPQNDTTEPGR